MFVTSHHLASHTQKKLRQIPRKHIVQKKLQYALPYICRNSFALPTHAQESNWELQNLTKEKTAIAIFSFVARPPP